MTSPLVTDFVVKECEARVKSYNRLYNLFDGDAPDVRAKKADALFKALRLWALDPVAFVNEVGWAPDPKGDFGGKDVPRGMSPRNMVPIFLYPEQEAFVRDFQRMAFARELLDMNVLKSRQVAFTSIIVLCILWLWLFHPGSAILVCSYDEALIDAGGKGHRTKDSLFGRFRLALDALFWSVPALRFNQQRGGKSWARSMRESTTGMDDSEDTKMKLTRPRWIVHGHPVFSDAYRNVIVGQVPNDQTGKGDTYTIAFLDELGEYNSKKAGTDKDAVQAVRPCCNHILSGGTIPKNGDLSSLFYRLCTTEDRADTLIRRTIHWTDVIPYMIDATWRCSQCGSDQPYLPKSPGPGERGIGKRCGACGRVSVVSRLDVTSPWFERIKQGNDNDPIALARYYQMDWYASVGDRAWYTFDRKRSLVPRAHTRGWRTIMGYDPGTSSSNPAAWLMCRFSDDLQTLRIVAYHQAADWPIQKWVPFFKCWSPIRLARQVVSYGGEAGKRWLDAYRYTPEEQDVLARISQYSSEDTEIWGDKYGTHRNAGMDSAYYVLSRYGIHVRSEYSTDKENRIAKARDVWLPRTEIDPEIADYRPRSGGEHYPSIVAVFSSTRMAVASGANSAKRVFDQNTPKHVAHLSDCFVYVTNALSDVPRARIDAGGSWQVQGSGRSEPVFYGESW